MKQTLCRSVWLSFSMMALAVLGGGCNSSALSEWIHSLSGNERPQYAFTRKAHRAAELQDYDTAIEYCTKAIKLDPGYAYAYGLRGSCYSYTGDDALALADCRLAIKLDPSASASYTLKARLVAGQGDYTNAIHVCTQAINAAPDEAYPYGLRASCYVKTGKYALALADCGRTIELDPHDSYGFTLRAGILFRKGDYAGALSDCNRAIEVEPDDAYTYGLRGSIYSRRGETDKAIRDVTKAIALQPDSGDFYLWRARVNLRAERLDAALADADKAGELDADNEQAGLVLASILALTGRAAEAMRQYDKLLLSSPDSALVLNAKAYALCTVPEAQYRDGEEAVRLAQKALELCADQPPFIVDTLACAYAEVGQFKKAIALQKEVVAGRSDDDEVRAHLAAFEAGKPWRQRQLKQ